MKIDKKIIKFFQTLADETRLKILISLIEESKTVTEIHNEVKNITLSAVSHQLKLMESQNIITFTKTGREKHFELSDNFCWCILKEAIEHKGEARCKKCSQIKSEGLK